MPSRKESTRFQGDPAFPVIGKGHDTKIYDVLKEGIHLLENPTSADSLLVVTDGFDEDSKTRPDKVLNEPGKRRNRRSGI